MRILKNNPQRMCIQCRLRDDQKHLFRLQCIENKIMRYTGIGRSFYVCHACALQENTKKHILGRYKIPKQYHAEVTQQLKEIFTDG